MEILSFGLIGFFLAIDMCTQDHFSFTHAKIGLAVTLLSCCQPIIAWFRPHKPPGAIPTDRLIFNVLHITIGLFCIIGGILNCSGGFEQIEKFGGINTKAWQNYFAPVHLIIVLVIIGGSHVVEFLQEKVFSGDEETGKTPKETQMSTTGGNAIGES